MFNMGIFELLVLGIVALFFIPPKDLPRLARSFSTWMNDLKRIKSQIVHSLDASQSVEKIKRQVHSLRVEKDQKVRELKGVKKSQGSHSLKETETGPEEEGNRKDSHAVEP